MSGKWKRKNETTQSRSAMRYVNSALELLVDHNHLALHTFERFRSIISTLAPPPPPRMVRSTIYTLRNMQDRRFSFEIATLNDR
jgi:hypothetical protein